MSETVSRRARCHPSVAALALACLMGASHAAEIQPLRESFLDAIFSQDSFGASPIDIRFNPGGVIHNADWRTIDLKAWGHVRGSLGALTESAGLAGSPTIPLFYVDGYVERGIPAPSVVGLARVGSAGVTVRADFQADLLPRPAGQWPCPPPDAHIPGCHVPSPAVGPAEIEAHRWRAAAVVAHELGHNLGLMHTLVENNLMDATLQDPVAYALTSLQVSTILSSRFVQTDAWGQRFISITPFAVLGAPVPEPDGWLLVGSALAVVGWRVRRRSQAPARQAERCRARRPSSELGSSATAAAASRAAMGR